MPDYSQGKIYQIVNDEMPGVCYIGSTTMSLNTRFGNHRCHAKNRGCISSKQLFEYGNPYIEILEEYPCQTRKELEQRERYYIENTHCINKFIPTRSKKEYHQDNREQISLKKKEYHQDNREQINAKKKDYYEKNKEQRNAKMKEYREKNKEQRNAKMKEYNEKNKEQINAKRREKIECECGCIVSRNSLSRHKKSNRHLNQLQSQLPSC